MTNNIKQCTGDQIPPEIEQCRSTEENESNESDDSDVESEYIESDDISYFLQTKCNFKKIYPSIITITITLKIFKIILKSLYADKYYMPF